jgi:hypothetical protein
MKIFIHSSCNSYDTSKLCCHMYVCVCVYERDSKRERERYRERERERERDLDNLNFDSSLVFRFYFFWCWGLKSGSCPCQTSTLELNLQLHFDCYLISNSYNSYLLEKEPWIWNVRREVETWLLKWTRGGLLLVSQSIFAVTMKYLSLGTL